MLQPMTEREVDAFTGYLADVLKVWDCYEQEWLEGSPVILRFEDADVVMNSDLETSAAFRFSYLDGDEQGLIKDVLSKEAECERCVCWLRVRSPKNPIGEMTSLQAILGE